MQNKVAKLDCIAYTEVSLAPRPRELGTRRGANSRRIELRSARDSWRACNEIDRRRQARPPVSGASHLRSVSSEVGGTAGREIVDSLARDDPRALVRFGLHRVRVRVTVLHPCCLDESPAVTVGDSGDGDHTVKRSASAECDERPRGVRLPRFRITRRHPENATRSG